MQRPIYRSLIPQKGLIHILAGKFSQNCVCLSFHLGLKRPEIGVGIKSKAGVTAGRTAAAAARL